MKVLHLVCTDIFSGAENVACQIIKGFEKNKEYEMVYCSPEGKNKKSLDDRNVKFLKLEKFDIKSVKKAIETFNPDIIHAHDIKASIMAALLSKSNMKVISHVHSNHENMRKINAKTMLYNFFSWRYNKIIWVSQSALDSYVFKNNVRDKSLVLYNVIDGREIEKRVQQDNNEYEEFDAIFLGRLTYCKNPERLIEIVSKVVEKVKEFKLAIVGSGDLEELIKEKIKEKGLEKNVKVLGFMTNPYKVLNSSKVMLLTSIYEGTPMCALEAMSLGKPIISTPTDGMKEVIIQGFNGYLSESDEEIEKYIIALTSDEKKLKEFSQNALVQFDKISNIKKYVDTLDKIYSE